MEKKYIIIVTSPELEAYGSFKGFCQDKNLSYQTLANQKKTPQIGKPITIKGFTIHKVETK